jgi:hypothetical protein
MGELLEDGVLVLESVAHECSLSRMCQGTRGTLGVALERRAA